MTNIWDWKVKYCPLWFESSECDVCGSVGAYSFIMVDERPTEDTLLCPECAEVFGPTKWSEYNENEEEESSEEEQDSKEEDIKEKPP